MISMLNSSYFIHNIGYPLCRSKCEEEYLTIPEKHNLTKISCYCGTFTKLHYTRDIVAYCTLGEHVFEFNSLGRKFTYTSDSIKYSDTLDKFPIPKWISDYVKLIDEITLKYYFK